MTAYSQTSKAVKFDEFSSINCEEYLAKMDLAIIQARSNPTSKIIVHIYEGNVIRYKYEKDGTHKTISVLPEYGLANAKIHSMKKYLSLRKVSLDQFHFVNAGFRKDFTVEMWLVPVEALEPELAPTLTKIKFRKGKPTGFCLGCCGP